jgi:nitrile hydratase beta subunit
VNGVHDIGGMDGLGAVAPTPAEPPFSNDWERAVFAMLVPSMMAGFNLDEFRHGIERMHPAEYLSTPYYHHWLHTMETNLVEKGVIKPAELAERVRRYREQPDTPLPDREDPALAERLVVAAHAGASTRMDGDVEPAFKPGDPVVVRNHHPHGHTRLARYLRGKRGVVERSHGSFVYPDTNAHGRGENPQPVYTVRFDAAEVWGEETAEPNTVIHFDVWQPYLEPAR